MKLRERFMEVAARRRLAGPTIQCYWRWIEDFLRFHRVSGQWVHPSCLAEREVEAFLNDLARRRRVSASTQNQALNAVVILYKQLLVRKDVHEFRKARLSPPPLPPIHGSMDVESSFRFPRGPLGVPPDRRCHFSGNDPSGSERSRSCCFTRFWSSLMSPLTTTFVSGLKTKKPMSQNGRKWPLLNREFTENPGNSGHFAKPWAVERRMRWVTGDRDHLRPVRTSAFVSVRQSLSVAVEKRQNEANLHRWIVNVSHERTSSRGLLYTADEPVVKAPEAA